MKFENLLLEQHEGLARITLNRPDKLNSFTLNLLRELLAAVEHLVVEQETRVLVLSGAGKAFCAGQDLGALDDVSKSGFDDLGEVVAKYYGPLIEAITSAPFPVVAMVNGVAAGAGANLALACDIVVAAETARFIQPFSRLNLIPDTGGTYFLPKLVGRARAMGAAMLGTVVDARQAESWGMIWKCVAKDDLEAQTQEVIAQLMLLPPGGLEKTKQAFNDSYCNSLQEQLKQEANLMSELSRSIEFQNAVEQFLKKKMV